MWNLRQSGGNKEVIESLGEVKIIVGCLKIKEDGQCMGPYNKLADNSSSSSVIPYHSHRFLIISNTDHCGLLFLCHFEYSSHSCHNLTCINERRWCNNTVFFFL